MSLLQENQQGATSCDQQPWSNTDFTLTYLDESPDLDPEAPLGHPHIIDVDKLPEGLTEYNAGMLNLRFADGITTLLFKYNPEALEDFLDPIHDYFTMWITEDEAEDDDNLLVLRDGVEVIAGNLDSVTRIWKTRFYYTISDSGKWEPKQAWTTFKGLSEEPRKIEKEADKFSFRVLRNERWQDWPEKRVKARRGFNVEKETLLHAMDCINNSNIVRYMASHGLREED